MRLSFDAYHLSSSLGFCGPALLSLTVADDLMTGGPHSILFSLGRPNVLRPTADCSSLGLSCAASLPPLPFGPMADGLNELSICHDLLEKIGYLHSLSLSRQSADIWRRLNNRGRNGNTEEFGGKLVI